jgi:hypothetical protein
MSFKPFDIDKLDGRLHFHIFFVIIIIAQKALVCLSSRTIVRCVIASQKWFWTKLDII